MAERFYPVFLRNTWPVISYTDQNSIASLLVLAHIVGVLLEARSEIPPLEDREAG